MYRVRSTGEVLSQGQVRSLYPNTSFPKTWSPELVEELGLDPVLESPAPAVNRYQTAYKDGTEQDANGNWVWKWSISEMSDDAKQTLDNEQANNIRATRNKLISDCDWTQLDDTPVTNAKKLEWATYRQALRDITTQSGFPWEVTWPTKPE